MDFYVGTLTREGGRGILCCKLQHDQLKCEHIIEDIHDPNYVITSADGQRMYAVSSDGDDGGYIGCVSEYDLRSVKPAMISRKSTKGNGPCYLTLSPDERFLYVANYGTGSLTAFPASPTLKERVQWLPYEGCGPCAVRQASPHLHQVTFVPGRQLLCAVDLGTDLLRFYHADPVDGMLTEAFTFHLPGGPRHVAYASNGCVYVAHELSNEVTCLVWRHGSLVSQQTLSTLPADWRGGNTASAIRISRDQKRVMVSNRGHGSIAVFHVLANGSLAFEKHVSAGSFPRDFVELPDGRTLIADQRAGVHLLSAQGKRLDFLEEVGAVCICPRYGTMGYQSKK